MSKSYRISHPGYVNAHPSYLRDSYTNDQYYAIRPWLRHKSVKINPEESPKDSSNTSEKPEKTRD